VSKPGLFALRKLPALRAKGVGRRAVCPIMRHALSIEVVRSGVCRRRRRHWRHLVVVLHCLPAERIFGQAFKYCLLDLPHGYQVEKPYYLAAPPVFRVQARSRS
jgi:hypothetical protein